MLGASSIPTQGRDRAGTLPFILALAPPFPRSPSPIIRAIALPRNPRVTRNAVSSACVWHRHPAECGRRFLSLAQPVAPNKAQPVAMVGPMEECRVFLSAVSSEFGAAQNALADDFARRRMMVRVQQHFRRDRQPGTTLAALDAYIATCTAVIS